MEENKKFNAELEIVRFEDIDVITESCPSDAIGCPDDLFCDCEYEASY